MAPKRVTVALALDENEEASITRTIESPEAVRNRFVSRSPAEPLIALLALCEPQASSYRDFFSVDVVVRDLDCRGAPVDRA